MTRPERWAWVDVDLDAIRHNVTHLRSVAAPADVWAVVKADGYGHGAVAVATAALDGGAAGLCVALVEEGIELRDAGIDAPVLVLSEPPAAWMGELIAGRLRPTVYTAGGIDAVAAAAEKIGQIVSVHLKVDTGMNRVGADPADGLRLARRVLSHASLRLEAVFTHLAVADDAANAGTSAQLDRLEQALAELSDHGIRPPVVHAANSAGTLAHPRARRSLVRTGIAVYGLPPSPSMAPLAVALKPALSLKARVTLVKPVASGASVSYGWRHTFAADTVVATLPLGYADGVPRRLFETGGEVLLGGQRRRVVGVVTMDQLMVDCGAGPAVAVGDEAVLLGRQGGEVITADEWAERLGTINYEVVCGLGPRLPRRYLGSRPEGGR